MQGTEYIRKTRPLVESIAEVVIQHPERFVSDETSTGLSSQPPGMFPENFFSFRLYYKHVTSTSEVAGRLWLRRAKLLPDLTTSKR